MTSFLLFLKHIKLSTQVLCICCAFCLDCSSHGWLLFLQMSIQMSTSQKLPVTLPKLEPPPHTPHHLIKTLYQIIILIFFIELVRIYDYLIQWFSVSLHFLAFSPKYSVPTTVYPMSTQYVDEWLHVNKCSFSVLNSRKVHTLGLSKIDGTSLKYDLKSREASKHPLLSLKTFASDSDPVWASVTGRRGGKLH